MGFKRFFRIPEANPILVYELRQIVRNRLILWLTGVYLLSMVVFLGGSLIMPEQWGVNQVLTHSNVFSGGALSFQVGFGLFCMFYAYTTLLLIAFGAIRLSVDRVREDASLYTIMPPRRIVLGKIQFGFIVGLLFASMTLPFLSVAYLLRGLDPRWILYGFVWFFSITQVHYALATAFSAGAKTKARVVTQSVLMLLAQFLLGLFFYVLLILVIMFALPDISFIPGVAIPVFLACFICGLLYLLTGVQLSPETSNRMLPVRAVLSVIFLLFFLALLLLFPILDSVRTRYSSDFLPLHNLIPLYYDVFCSLALPFFFLVFICERDCYPYRVRRTIPKTLWKRLAVFPFYTGAANALTWSVATLIFIAVVNVSAYTSKILNSAGYLEEEILKTLGFDLLFFDYAAMTFLLYQLFFRRRFPREWNWVPLTAFLLLLVVLLFFGEFGLLPYSNVLNPLSEMPFLPIPWGGDGRWFLPIQLSIGVVWLIMLAVVGFPWLRRRFGEFKAPEEDDRDALRG